MLYEIFEQLGPVEAACLSLAYWNMYMIHRYVRNYTKVSLRARGRADASLGFLLRKWASPKWEYYGHQILQGEFQPTRGGTADENGG